MKTAKTAFSYIRFSTPEQAKGDSLKRQKEASAKWCKQNGYTLSNTVFFDAGVSGRTGKHLAVDKAGRAKGELKRFLQLVEDGTIQPGSILLVENFDRISRLPPVESMSLFLGIITAGIGIVFTASYEQRIITKELLNKESYALQMVMGECIRAYEESRRKSEMVTKAKKTKRDEILTGKVVTHNNVPKYFTFDKEKNKYHHNDNTKVVTEIVDDYLAGNSLYSIATKLNEKMTPPFRYGSQWSACSVRAILRNKALIGEFMGNPKFLPKIVEKEDFARVQVQLNRNKGFAGQTGELINIFRGICFCTCGKAMSVLSNSKDYRTKKKWKHPYRYLRCSKVGTGKNCDHRKVIKLEPIEDEFFGVFLLQDPRQMLGNTDNAELKRLKTQRTQHQANIDRISDEISTTLALSKRVKSKIAEFAEEFDRLEAEREKEKASIDEVNLQISAVTAAPTDFKDMKKLFKNISSNTRAYDDAVRSIKEDLKDNELRKKLRVLLPSQIGKIVVDTEKGTWVVYNRSGAKLYTGPFDHPSTYITSKAA